VANWLRNAILLAGMIAASGLALALKPTHKVADTGPKVNLDTLIPRQFDDWKEAQFGASQIVDPQQREMLNKIYNQTLTRTYVNASGYVIMLSIAYGSDQSDGLQLHKPEICYPAQGFALLDKRVGTLSYLGGAIPATRILTTLGTRVEPVTYWTIVGDRVIVTGIQKKLVEMRYGFAGQIPDGMLVRVSSVDKDTERAYRMQGIFAERMLGAVAAADLPRLIGKVEAPAK
jgi:EpsI family protein